MTTYVYVDNSNFFIEGRRVSAVQRGMAKGIGDAIQRSVIDFSWHADYGKLYDFLKADVTVAKLWGSPPPGDSFWKMVGNVGFTTKIYDRNAGNKEKKVDVAIAITMIEDAYTQIDKAMDAVLLVAGDSDFVPAVAKLKAMGIKVEVAFWGHAARELREIADYFYELDGKLGDFTRTSRAAA